MKTLASVALAGLLGTSVVGCGAPSVITPGGGPRADVSGSPSPTATVYASMDEACRGGLLIPSKDPSASYEPGEDSQALRQAEADADDLADSLLDLPDVQSVGVGVCQGPVVIVGVSSQIVSVPITGVRGTPVLAVRQGPVVAF